MFKCLWFDLHSIYRDICVGSTAELSEQDSATVSVEGEFVGGGEGFRYRVTIERFGETLHSFEQSTALEFGHPVFGDLKDYASRRPCGPFVYPMKLVCGLHALNFEDQRGAGAFLFAAGRWVPGKVESIDDVMAVCFSAAADKEVADPEENYLKSAVESVFDRSQSFFVQLKRYLARKTLAIRREQLHRCLVSLLEEVYWVLDKLHPFLSIQNPVVGRAHHLIGQLLAPDINLQDARRLIKEYDRIAQGNAIVIEVDKFLKSIASDILKQVLLCGREGAEYSREYRPEELVGFWRQEKQERITYLSIMEQAFKKEIKSKLYAAVDVKTRRVIMQGAEINVLVEHSGKYISINSRGIEIIDKDSLLEEINFSYSIIASVPVIHKDRLFVVIESGFNRDEKTSVLDINMSGVRDRIKASCYRVSSFSESKGTIDFVFGNQTRIGALIHQNPNLELLMLFSEEKPCGRLLNPEVNFTYPHLFETICETKSNSWTGQNFRSTAQQIIDVWMIQKDDLLILSTFNQGNETFMGLLLVEFSEKGNYKSSITGDFKPMLQAPYSHVSYSSFIYHRGRTCAFVLDKHAGSYQLFTFRKNKIFCCRRRKLIGFKPNGSLMMTRSSDGRQVYASSSDKYRLELVVLNLIV